MGGGGRRATYCQAVAKRSGHRSGACYDCRMALTADDLVPLLARLPRSEQVRLARIALAAAAHGPNGDAAAYAARPPQPEELADGPSELLGWDAEGWDDVA
jgi:hypothetical protein